MRRRRRVAAALSLTIAAGVASRCWPLPGPLAEYTGDALYATAVWFAAALLWPRARVAVVTAIALAGSAAVECSQLATAQWLVDLRATTVGQLLLGQGFQWADLAAGAIGALLGAGASPLLSVTLPPNDRRGTDLP